MRRVTDRSDTYIDGSVDKSLVGRVEWGNRSNTVAAGGRHACENAAAAAVRRTDTPLRRRRRRRHGRLR